MCYTLFFPVVKDNGLIFLDSRVAGFVLNFILVVGFFFFFFFGLAVNREQKFVSFFKELLVLSCRFSEYAQRINIFNKWLSFVKWLSSVNQKSYFKRVSSNLD